MKVCAQFLTQMIYLERTTPFPTPGCVHWPEDRELLRGILRKQH